MIYQITENGWFYECGNVDSISEAKEKLEEAGKRVMHREDLRMITDEDSRMWFINHHGIVTDMRDYE